MSGESFGVGLDATLRDFSGGQKVFNRYTLIKTLGRGGMGIVWLAHDEVLDRDVALKFLPEIIIQDRAVLEDLKRETKRSLELTHKNVVRIHDFVHDVVSACISMEYIEGDTLSNLRADKPNKIFEPDELKPWLIQLCDALDYAHNHARIIHRDLKPSNLMISKRGYLKVADFGIARSLSDSVSMLTHARGTSGTLVYMSPQQLDGDRGTHLDDIYSLGATIYELLTSKPPFYSGNIDRQIREKIASSMTQRRRDLEVDGNPIPKNWEETVGACLAKEPAKRPQSVADIANSLQLAEPLAPESAGTTKEFGGRNIFVMLAGLLLLTGFAVSVIFYLRTMNPQPAYPTVNQGVRPIEVTSPSTPSGTVQYKTDLHEPFSPTPTETVADDLERQRQYLHESYSRNTATALQTTPSPVAGSFFNSVTQPVSHEFDGTWEGQDQSSPWTATLIIKDGKFATCTQERIIKLSPKSDHWNENDIAPPYNKSHTIVRRWTAESRLVEVTASGLNIYWKDWSLQLKPTIPLSVLPGEWKTGPENAWGIRRQGTNLVSGNWKFHRK